MSKAQTIAKLESLLERIRGRASEPRPAPSKASAVAVPARVPAPAAAPPPPAPEPVFEAQEVELPPPSPVVAPLVVEAPPREAPAVTEPEIVLDVDVQASTQDAVIAVAVDNEIELVPAPEARESRERIVGAEPVAEEESGDAPAAVVEEEIELVASPPPPAELAAEAPPPPPLATPEPEPEEAPVSSRRPVALQPEERLDEMAFGAEEPQPARHTPPPESGRLPAAPPAADFDGDLDITGVRDAAKPAPSVELVPEATIADLALGEGVGDLVGQPRAATPSTFVAVLDASLAL